jgi:putative GTP pyrophosphokinase
VNTLGDSNEPEVEPFDFEAHRNGAVAEYLPLREHCGDFARTVQSVIHESLKRRDIKVSSVDARAKDVDSFTLKAGSSSSFDPNVPKYNDPVSQITDLAAVRIIAVFPSEHHDIHRMIDKEFSILEYTDKGDALIEEERFGYRSVHDLITMRPERVALPEYVRFAESIAEIQVRTVLQHAWAEIEHDIQYKSAAVIPTEIRRRFMTLAGLLELADREFQAIQDADRQLKEAARASVVRGDLNVEITPDAVKTYLDTKLGPDARISRESYDWIARLLKTLGFATLDQVDQCTTDYDGTQISRIAEGYRLGQISRFEYLLLVGMGENYSARHPFAGDDWFQELMREKLKAFADNGLVVGTYDPLSQVDGP